MSIDGNQIKQVLERMVQNGKIQEGFDEEHYMLS